MAASLRSLPPHHRHRHRHRRPHDDPATPPWRLPRSWIGSCPVRASSFHAPGIAHPPRLHSSPSSSFFSPLPPRIWKEPARRLTGSPGISASSSSGKPKINSASSFAEEMLRQLQRQMDMAIAQEDYLTAASTRDTINTLLEQDPVLKLQTQISKAVEEERFEDATEYRNQLTNMMPKSSSDPHCYSDTTTQGIRVEVRSVYISERSQPLKGQYFFAYRVRISNNCSRSVQVLSRHWIISDANGRTEHVRGLGVVGQQPVLLPGTNFEYTSACPLGTPSGKMEGTYELRYVDEVTTLTFNVEIGSFDLVMPNDQSVQR